MDDEMKLTINNRLFFKADGFTECIGVNIFMALFDYQKVQCFWNLFRFFQNNNPDIDKELKYKTAN